MNAKLKDIIERVQTWPHDAQEQLAQIALEMESELEGDYDATPDELAAIDRGLRDAAEGRFATGAKIDAVFAKFRQK